MGGWLESLIPWGTEWIVWVQGHSAPWLDTLARTFTTLGYEEFYLVALPAVYWCIHRELGIGLGFVSMLSAWANSAVKAVFALPRPDDARILMKAPRAETSPSFPSGHAQNAVANWGYVALRLRRAWFAVLAALTIACIGLSRIVLGVHFPQDVLGGWLLGLLLLGLFAWSAPRVARWLGRQSLPLQAALAVVAPLVLCLVHPAESGGAFPAEGAVTPAGALAGLGVGVLMERAWVRFRVQGPLLRRLLRFLLGIVVVAALYLGPSQAMPEALPHVLQQLLRFLRYGLVGWTVAFLCPWLFVRVRLASREAAS